MINISKCLLLLLAITPANVQFAVPMFPPPPAYPYPPPPPPRPVFPQPGMFVPPGPGMVAMAPVPPPMVIMAVPADSGERTTTTSTTTTTTERAMAIAVPVPVPLPVQVAIPAFPPPAFCNAKPRPKNCPPCPPCQCQPICTPAFFSYCSPCHLKCRCRNGDPIPAPLPPIAPQPIPGPAFPIPAPIPPYNPSIMIVPYPPMVRPRYPASCKSSSSRECRRESSRRKERYSSSESTSSSDASCSGSFSSESDSSLHLRQGHKRQSKHSRKGPRQRHPDKKRKRIGRLRSRGFDKMQFNNFRRRIKDQSDDELVKPVLSYITSNGEVRLQQSISAADAANLMEMGSPRARQMNQMDVHPNQRDVLKNQRDVQTIKVVAGEDPSGQSQVLMISSDNNQGQNADERKLMLRDRMDTQSDQLQMLHSGKKQIRFKPLKDKRIANLSLSFQVT